MSEREHNHERFPGGNFDEFAWLYPTHVEHHGHQPEMTDIRKLFASDYEHGSLVERSERNSRESAAKWLFVLTPKVSSMQSRT
jgi:hypothetical protein